MGILIETTGNLLVSNSISIILKRHTFAFDGFSVDSTRISVTAYLTGAFEDREKKSAG